MLLHRVTFALGVGTLVLAIAIGLVHAVRSDKKLPSVQPPSYSENIERLIEEEKYQAAIDQLLLAISIEPRDNDIRRLLLALDHAKKTKLLTATQCDEHEIRAWKKLLVINTQAHFSSDVFFHLGSAQLRSGEKYWSDARTNLEKALQLMPRSEETRSDLARVEANLARVLIRQRHFPQAGRLIQSARSRDPEPKEVRLAAKEYGDALKQ